MRQMIMVLLLLQIALAGTAVAGPFEEAMAAHARGDYSTAMRGFRVLAEQGAPEAQFNLGAMYASGQGMPQDYRVLELARVEAVVWYRKAAEQGLAGAQYSLGLVYDNGQGVTQDYVEAAKWYRMASEQGHAGGQTNLGVMYSRGNGLPQDYVQAHMWFSLAAKQGETHAAANRDFISRRMSPDQISEAQKLAGEWMPK